MNVFECAYCGAAIEGDGQGRTIPPESDDAAWKREAFDHLAGCEWVETRAHRHDAKKP